MKNRFAKDIHVEAEIDADNVKVEWKGDLPITISMALATFKYFDLIRHPHSCLVLAINQVKDVCESLRPRKEIDKVLKG